MTEQFERSGQAKRVAIAILAAGGGTRMKSEKAKHTHPIGGIPIATRIVRAAQTVDDAEILLVVSEKHQDMAAELGLENDVRTVIQPTPDGTAGAVLVAMQALPDDVEYVVSLLGDNPLLTGEVIQKVLDQAIASDAHVTILTCDLPHGDKYGRIVVDGNGNVRTIIEFSEDEANGQLAIRDQPTTINSGAMVVKRHWAQEVIPGLEVHGEKEERYLTDLVEVAAGFGEDPDHWPVISVNAVRDVAVGVNDRSQQSEADEIVRKNVRKHLMEEVGVTFIGPDTSFVDESVAIGQDTTILPGCILTGDTVIGTDCTIGPYAVINNSTIGNGVRITNSTIEDSEIRDGADIGPYSHVRGASVVGEEVHLGNFVELKKTTMSPGSKSGHFSYLGDATIGERTNIGAGTITANYDGSRKNPTALGNDVFIGSDTVLVAPVTVGDGGRTGAGAVVLRDVAAGETVVGVPAKPLPDSGDNAKGER